MKSKIFFIFIISLFFVSCSKNDSNKDSNNYSQKQTNQNQQNTQSRQGPQLIDFTWNEKGHEMKLSDYKGKVILLNFWATWCGPCRHELPDLSQIAEDLKDKDFKMIGVSVDQNKSQLDGFLKSNSLSYSIAHNPNDLLSRYMSATGMSDDVIPQTFIIDKSGKIVETLIGSHSKADFMKVINKYL